jgi:hypothetical protein
LPQGLLATVDIICDQQDLTRSQVFRRSITEYLKSQHVEIVDAEPKRTWSEALYRAKSMIGKQRRPEITRMSQLQDELRNASFDKLKVFEGVTSVQEIDSYIRQNRQLTHDVIIVSHR